MGFSFLSKEENTYHNATALAVTAKIMTEHH